MAALNGNKVVAAGVKREEGHRHYWLKGKREDLLRSGLVRETWFPGGERNGRGQLVRTKYSEVDDGAVCCRHIRNERYEVLVPYPAAEAERRVAEHKLECAQQHDQRLQGLAAKLAALPHFDPEDGLSERELLIMRIVRALDQRRWESLDAVLTSLLEGLEGLPDVEAVKPRSPAHLRLVVDNTRGATSGLH